MGSKQSGMFMQLKKFSITLIPEQYKVYSLQNVPSLQYFEKEMLSLIKTAISHILLYAT